MKKQNKVILYNLGRYQLDFEYMFPDVIVEKYITDNIEQLKKDVILLEHLEKNNQTLIIICDRKNAKYKEKFDAIKYKEGKNYLYLEDYVKVLDEKPSSKYKYIEEKFWYNNYHPEKSCSEMFKEMIYTDPRFDFDCFMPFNYVQVQTFGFVYPCCQGWAKYNIGNIYFTTPEKVWLSTKARLYRLSVENKTYAFCNPDNCPYLNDEHKIDIRGTNQKEKIKPEITCLAFDYTCNLHCKSCRNSRMNYNADKDYQAMYNNIVSKLTKSKWLESHELLVASQGEALLGKPYRKILFSDKINRKSLTLHTNATLLNKQTLDKLINKYSEITIYISLDASTKETYEKIRTGGNFDFLMKNLKNISEAKKEGKIKYVSILFVLQRENYLELKDACKIAIDLGFDRFDVTRIFNWGTYTQEEFKQISMYDENGNAKEELKEVLKDPIFKTDKIEIVGNVFK